MAIPATSSADAFAAHVVVRARSHRDARRRFSASIAFLLALVPVAGAAVFDAGVGYTYPTLASLPPLSPGDEVRLHPGTYTEAIRWRSSGTLASPILIHSVGYPRAVIDATGVDVTGVGSRPRAAFQIEGSHIIVDGLLIRGARNGHNGAGVRVTGAVDVTLRNTVITSCDSGMMSDGMDGLVIDGCEIAQNGAGDGVSHNLYVMGGSVTMRGCWVHHPAGGQNFKTRAHMVSLLCNRIEASVEGEIGIVDDAAQTTSPNSNAVLVGNTVISIPRPVGSNSVKFLVFGQDVGGVRNGTLYAFGNTFIAGTNHIRFLDATNTGVNLVASGNVFVGSDNVAMGTWQTAVGASDWASTTAPLPSGFTGTVRGLAPGFVGVGSGNVRLTASSACIDLAPWSATYLDGSGLAQDGTPVSEYLGVGFLGPRVIDGRPDAGAYEYVATNTAPMISAIADVAIAQDSPGTATCQVADRETAAAALTLSATSSDQLLVPDSAIQVSNAPSGVTIALAPTTNRNGTARITVAASDGSLVGTASFQLTVTPLAWRPWVSGIASQQVTAGVISAPIAFTVSDPAGPATSLAVSGWSTNQSVVRDGDLAFAGSGASRSLTITPASTATGTTTVWVQAADGPQSGYTSFTVTVVSRVVPPTVVAPASQVLALDHGTGPLAFTLADAPPSTIVTATSSNTALVPAANIVLGGTGANRTVAVQPASGARGSATITLTATNGALSGSATFGITVRAPPTIAPIAHQIVPLNQTSGPIAITLADSDMPVASLTLSAMSTNETVVPSSGIVFSGTGADRTMIVATNTNGTWGETQIIVTVSDGALSSSTSFGLSDWAPPVVFPPAAQTIAIGTSSGPLPVVIGDSEVLATALTLTATSSNHALLPDASLVLGGSAGNRTVMFTPVAGIQGTAIVSLTVFDGTTATTRSFQVTVRPPPTISTLADAVIAQGGTLGPVVFTVGDGSLPASALVVQASSSDPTIVPPANVVLSGSADTRTITVQPAGAAVGSTTISLTVSDGVLSTAASFTVTVRTPPTIAAIVDQVVDQDQPTAPIALSIGSAQIPAASLTVAATSSNQALVRDAALVVGGSGSVRALTATPVAGQVGVATITVTVSDGALATSTSFALTVRPVNHPPTIVDLVATPIDSSTSALAVTASDDGGEGALSYSWSSTGPAAVAFSRNGDNGAKSMVATYAAAGSYVVTATATDAQGLGTSRSLAVTVAAQATSVLVTPATALVQTGDALAFTASVRDQFGAALAARPIPTWSVGGGGSVNASGVFTAGSTTGGPFAVTASAGAAVGSATVTVTTPPFHGNDVGVVSPIGSSRSVNGVWTVQGSGADIWGTADAFQYARYVVGGDVQITARVDSIGDTDPWAKAGVMIRESLDPASKQALTCVTAHNGIAYQRRPVTAGASLHTAGPSVAAPYWVRLSRIGTTVTSSCSVDGVTWRVVASETLSLSAKVYIGLAVTSHHNGTLCTAVFSDVSVIAAPSTAN